MMSLYRMVSPRGKWLFIALMAFTMQVHAATNQDSAALVTLKVSNAPIEDVFLRIEAQTGFSFTYSTQLIDKKEKVSVDFKREQLGDVLRELLGKRNLRWVIRGGGIVILKDGDRSPPQLEKKYAIDSLPNEITIKGTVTAEEGFPLPGASIQIKGMAKGTVTNSNGIFRLSGIQPNDRIIVSYTGYFPQEFSSAKSETILLKLKQDVGTLDEQVVIAYGTSSRRMLTGSVGRVTSKQIEQQPVQNVLQAIQGRMPGVSVVQQSGLPGGNYNIQIRGQNSLRNVNGDYGNAPFYIVDGVPFSSTPFNVPGVGGPYPNVGNNPITGASPLNTINPLDIESVEILKDADATAIYGSRGANGVVLITTKKGKAGKMNVSANLYAGVGHVPRKMELLSTPQYIEMRKEAFKNDGITAPASTFDLLNWDTTRFTDWQKELIGGSANILDAQFGITGGNTQTQYSIGLGYHRESTVFPGDFADKRISAHINFNNISLNKKFKQQISLSVSGLNTDLTSQDLTSVAITLPPNAPSLRDAAGNINWEENTFENPIAYTKRTYLANTFGLIGNMQLSYNIVKRVNVKLSLGYTKSDLNELRKTPLSSYNPVAAMSRQNTTQFGDSDNSSWIVEPQINYQNRFDNHEISVLVGSTFQSQSNQSMFQDARGFVTEALMENIAAVPASNISSRSGESEYRYSAIFGRIGYNYRSKYLLNLTGRRDGSSRFGPGNRFGNFGSVGMGWIFSNEDFIRTFIPFLSFGKIRSSYGITGSDQIPGYGYLNTYTTVSAGQYQTTAAIIPSRLLNPSFRWEKNKKFEAAIELGGLKDGVLLTTSYYRNRSSNQLVGYPLPGSTGFTTVRSNLDATVQNSGWEFELFTKNLSRKKITWSTNLNITLPRNQLVSYPNLSGSPYADVYVVGEPLSIQKHYFALGVDPETGSYIVLDVDKNGQFNAVDRQKISEVTTELMGGMQNTLTFFNSLEINIFIQFAKQKGGNNYLLFSVPGQMLNQPVSVMERWQAKGDVKSFQKFTQSSTTYNRYRGSDASVSDASYARLKNISVSYRLPEKLTSPIHLKSLKTFIQAQNLFTITGYDGLDPETRSLILPPLRVITAGIQVVL